MNSAEEIVASSVQWLRLFVESIGAIIVGSGVIIAAFSIVRGLLANKAISFNQVRINLARYLALGLEFQLGADILSTAVAPSWDQIGKLGVIAVIRTALNFFLTREMQEERAQIENEGVLMNHIAKNTGGSKSS